MQSKKVGSVHFPNNHQKIKPSLNHNDRTCLKSPNIHQEYTHLNECTATAKEVRKEIDKLYKEAMSKMAGKKGKRTPKNNSFTECIIECDENTSMEQLKELTQKIADLTGFTPLQIAFHKDEGRDKGEGFKTHYHAHAVFFTLDKETGKQLARNSKSLNPENLSKMQDLGAEILLMQRGEKRFDKEEFERCKAEHRAYKNPKKKAYFQSYQDYHAYQDRKDELEKREQELFKMEQELKEREKRLKEQEDELKLKNEAFLLDYEALKLKEQELKELQASIEYDHRKAFDKLEQEHLSNVKGFKAFTLNALTLGKRNQRLKNQYAESKKALTATLHEAKKEYSIKEQSLKNEIANKENQLNESYAINQQLRADKKALEQDLQQVRGFSDKYYNELKTLKGTILQGFDIGKERTFLLENGELSPQAQPFKSLIYEAIEKYRTPQKNTTRMAGYERGF